MYGRHYKQGVSKSTQALLRVGSGVLLNTDCCEV
jgi:hypothetical protein